jgi:hypothetical protein
MVFIEIAAPVLAMHAVYEIGVCIQFFPPERINLADYVLVF